MLIASLFLALALAGGQDEKLLTYSQKTFVQAMPMPSCTTLTIQTGWTNLEARYRLRARFILVNSTKTMLKKTRICRR